MKKIIFIITIFYIIPQLVLAAWWNPFTWKIFSFLKKDNVKEEKIIVATTTEEVIVNESENEKQIEEKTVNLLENEKIEKVILKTEEKNTNQTTSTNQTPKVYTLPNGSVIDEFGNLIKSAPIVESEVKEKPVQNNTTDIVSVNYSSVVDFNLLNPEDLYAYAQEASNKTGVPIDLLLHVAKNQQSTSSCYMGISKINMTSSMPKSLNSIFFTLGLEPSKTAISCDGLVGAGIFHPSTWINISQNRDIKNINRGDVPLLNPWDPKDVILVIALHLGSSGGSYDGGILTGSFIVDKACGDRHSLCYGYIK